MERASGSPGEGELGEGEGDGEILHPAPQCDPNAMRNAPCPQNAPNPNRANGRNANAAIRNAAPSILNDNALCVFSMGPAYLALWPPLWLWRRT